MNPYICDNIQFNSILQNYKYILEFDFYYTELDSHIIIHKMNSYIYKLDYI